MRTTTFSNALLPLAGLDGQPEAEAKPGFFRRLLDAMVASRQAQAERELRRISRAYGIEITNLEAPSNESSRGLPFQQS